MSVMMDIVFAAIIGAVITLITINANFVIRQAWASYNSEIIVQQMLVSDAQLVESEFRNMGCGIVSDTTKIVLQAYDTCITYLMALRPEPYVTPERIKYYSGSVAELSFTENPNDRFLYRQQNGGALERVGTITKFFIKYFTTQNDSIATPITGDDLKKIGIIEITLEVQTPYASFIDENGNKRFAEALWKQTRLASQNLRR